MRGILKRILTSLALETLDAVDGKDALAKLAQTTPPDLALVDWNMPNMNGFQFVQAIRENHAFDSMKIVMVTTEVEMSQMTRALEAGANEYVMKPFTEQAMIEKLQMLGFSAPEEGQVAA